MNYSVYDAITNESIKDGDFVYSVILESNDAESSGELVKSHSRRNYSFSLFPVSGQWDSENSLVVPAFTTEFEELVYSKVFGKERCVEIQLALIDSNLNKEKSKSYCMMVIKKETLDDIKSNPRVKLFTGNYNPIKFSGQISKCAAEYSSGVNNKSVRVFNGVGDILALRSRIRSFHGQINLDIPFGVRGGV